MQDRSQQLRNDRAHISDFLFRLVSLEKVSWKLPYTSFVVQMNTQIQHPGVAFNSHVMYCHSCGSCQSLFSTQNEPGNLKKCRSSTLNGAVFGELDSYRVVRNDFPIDQALFQWGCLLFLINWYHELSPPDVSPPFDSPLGVSPLPGLSPLGSFISRSFHLHLIINTVPVNYLI